MSPSRPANSRSPSSFIARKGLVGEQNRIANRLRGLLAEFDIVATVGNARDFKNGRQFATWLGLTSRQFSTDGKSALGKITKHSDVYLRTLLIHGARSELMHVHDRIIVAMLAKESEVLGPDPASEAGDTSDYVQAA